MTSVVIVDDAQLREQAARLRSPAGVREELVGGRAPDVVVLDATDTADAPELCALLRDALPESALLVLGPDEDGRAGVACLRAGAQGVAPRRELRDGLLASLDRLTAGRAELGAVTTRAVLDDLRAPTATGPGPGRLSPTNERILALMADGLTNRAIAERLGLAEKTVKNHATAIYTSLGVGNRAEATARWAQLHGPR